MGKYCPGICRNILRKTTRTLVFDTVSFPIFKHETTRIQARNKNFNIEHSYSAQVPIFRGNCLFIFCLFSWLVGRQAKRDDKEMSRRIYISDIRKILLLIHFSYTHFHKEKESNTFIAKVESLPVCGGGCGGA